MKRRLNNLTITGKSLLTEVDIKVEGLADIRSYLKRLPGNVFDAAKDTIGGSVLRVQKDVVFNSFASTGNTSGNRLVSRSRILRDSIKTSTKGDSFSNLSGSVFTNVKYAVSHELGTLNKPIKAKNKYVNVPGGPYLNIPLSPNKTASGVMRFSAKEVFLSQGGFLFKSKKGNWIVRNAAGQNMFVLRKETKFPARLGMQKAAENEIPTLLGNLDKLMGEAIL